jgi:hypothetical protein
MLYQLHTKPREFCQQALGVWCDVPEQVDWLYLGDLLKLTCGSCCQYQYELGSTVDHHRPEYDGTYFMSRYLVVAEPPPPPDAQATFIADLQQVLTYLRAHGASTIAYGPAYAVLEECPHQAQLRLYLAMTAVVLA